MSGPRSWLVLCLTHGVLSMLVWWAGLNAQSPLTWQAETWLGFPWSLWTTVWVHQGTGQLIMNQIALGLLTGLAWWVRPSGWTAVIWCLAWPLLHLSLLLWPQIGYACGLGGLLHAGFGVIAVDLLLRRDPSGLSLRWGGVLGISMLGKLILEHGWSTPVIWDAANEISVVQAGRLAGAAWGAALAALVHLVLRLKPKTGSSRSTSAA